MQPPRVTFFPVRYEGFGPDRPAVEDERTVFSVVVHGYPGALNQLDDEAVGRIAELEGVPRKNVRLLSFGLGGGRSVIEGLLRRHRPRFASEVDGGHAVAWFSYNLPFELPDF